MTTLLLASAETPWPSGAQPAGRPASRGATGIPLSGRNFANIFDGFGRPQCTVRGPSTKRLIQVSAVVIVREYHNQGYTWTLKGYVPRRFCFETTLTLCRCRDWTELPRYSGDTCGHDRRRCACQFNTFSDFRLKLSRDGCGARFDARYDEFDFSFRSDCFGK